MLISRFSTVCKLMSGGWGGDCNDSKRSGRFGGIRQWKESSGDKATRRTAGRVSIQQIKDVSGENGYEKCSDRNNKIGNGRNDYS
ncbi:hypothetical protein QYF36_019875 [Acer negundo]|nr:hypothetical protein QYF36_019875 [Acer negundo]